jgi:TRAP transporter TAXI family solute receptor
MRAQEKVGSALPVTAIVAAVAGLALVVIGIIGYLSLSGDDSDREIVIATGPETGNYHTLGTAFGRLLEAEGIVASVRVLETEGSAQNMELIGGDGDRADFALVQSDTVANAHARLVASLYEEHLHVLVARGLANEVRTIYELRGLRVSLGGSGSGTRQVARRVLDHFKVEPGEDLAISPARLVESFKIGDIDAAFVLTAVPSRSIQQLASDDAVRFLPLGDAQEVGNEADALALVHPSLHATAIPHSAYGRLPERPTLTVGVTAQLVAGRGVNESLVRRVTEAVFEHRSRVGVDNERLAVAQRIRERYSPGSSTIPYHPGAVAYYTRQQPAFVVEYAETMSLFLTLLVGVYSAYIALREWARRRRKNRIDAYYVEATSHFDDVHTASTESLFERRDALVELRRTAFRDLVDERLDANESFTILQDQIDSELRTIEALIRERSDRG